MTRVSIIKISVLLLFIGLLCGLTGQVELMKPRVSFLSESLWPQLLTVHVWATAISLTVICLSTISLVRDKTTIGQWSVWLGFAIVPILFGVLINLVLANAQSPNNFLVDTVYITANRHAFGTAGLLFALGGLSAFQTVNFERFPLKISFAFALLISGSGVALAFLQSIVGFNGMPRRYIDYPDAFAPFQFYSSISAIACFCLSVIYLILLWRHSYKKSSKIEEVF
jgi:heme/copper-type cytochrome/quinol oxidase subunit 1